MRVFKDPSDAASHGWTPTTQFSVQSEVKDPKRKYKATAHHQMGRLQYVFQALFVKVISFITRGAALKNKKIAHWNEEIHKKEIISEIYCAAIGENTPTKGFSKDDTALDLSQKTTPTPSQRETSKPTSESQTPPLVPAQPEMPKKVDISQEAMKKVLDPIWELVQKKQYKEAYDLIAEQQKVYSSSNEVNRLLNSVKAYITAKENCERAILLTSQKQFNEAFQLIKKVLDERDPASAKKEDVQKFIHEAVLALIAEGQLELALQLASELPVSKFKDEILKNAFYRAIKANTPQTVAAILDETFFSKELEKTLTEEAHQKLPKPEPSPKPTALPPKPKPEPASSSVPPPPPKPSPKPTSPPSPTPQSFFVPPVFSVPLPPAKLIYSMSSGTTTPSLFLIKQLTASHIEGQLMDQAQPGTQINGFDQFWELLQQKKYSEAREMSEQLSDLGARSVFQEFIAINEHYDRVLQLITQAKFEDALSIMGKFTTKEQLSWRDQEAFQALIKADQLELAVPLIRQSPASALKDKSVKIALEKAIDKRLLKTAIAMINEPFHHSPLKDDMLKDAFLRAINNHFVEVLNLILTQPIDKPRKENMLEKGLDAAIEKKFSEAVVAIIAQPFDAIKRNIMLTKALKKAMGLQFNEAVVAIFKQSFDMGYERNAVLKEALEMAIDIKNDETLNFILGQPFGANSALSPLAGSKNDILASVLNQAIDKKFGAGVIAILKQPFDVAPAALKSMSTSMLTITVDKNNVLKEAFNKLTRQQASWPPADYYQVMAVFLGQPFTNDADRIAAVGQFAKSLGLSVSPSESDNRQAVKAHLLSLGYSQAAEQIGSYKP